MQLVYATFYCKAPLHQFTERQVNRIAKALLATVGVAIQRFATILHGDGDKN